MSERMGTTFISLGLCCLLAACGASAEFPPSDRRPTDDAAVGRAGPAPDAETEQEFLTYVRMVTQGERPKPYVEKRAAKRIEAWQEAANRGVPEAQHLMGLACVYGAGVPQDESAAITWYEKAVARGLAAAQHTLGVRYIEGKGVPKDAKKSFLLLKAAAAQNYPPAISALGVSYEHGNGVDRDLKTAKACYRKAAHLGGFAGRVEWVRLELPDYKPPVVDPNVPEAGPEIENVWEVRDLILRRSIAQPEDVAAINKRLNNRAAQVVDSLFDTGGDANFLANHYDQFFAAIISADLNISEQLDTLTSKLADRQKALLAFLPASFEEGVKISGLGERISRFRVHVTLSKQQSADEKSLQEFRKAVENDFDEKSPVIGALALKYARRRISLNKWNDAQAFADAALDVFRKTADQSHEYIAESQVIRADILRHLGNDHEAHRALDDAMKQLVRVHAFQEKNFGRSHKRTTATRVRLLLIEAKISAE